MFARHVQPDSRATADGFNAVCILMSEESARRFVQWGDSIRRFSFLGLVLSWRLFDSLYRPIFAIAFKALYPGT